MDPFDQYEQELQRRLEVIKQKTKQLQTLNGEPRKSAITECERILEEARLNLDRMEQISKSGGLGERERQIRLQGKCRTYVSDLSRLQQNLQHNALIANTFGGSSFRGNMDDDPNDMQFDQRKQLLVSHQKLDDTSASLHNAHQISVATENIGADVMHNLHGQRQQLERTRDNLGLIDDNMTRGRKILSSMARRIATNKLILAFIIILLLATDGMIIYFKWIRRLVH